MATFAVAAAAALIPSLASAGGAEPNPPVWPPTVRVFSPADTDIEDVVNAAFATNGGHDPPNHGQFSSARFAFLFKPGNYTADVPVGFYTTVHGLGLTPDNVVFAGDKGVYCEEGDYVFNGGALDTFWRGVENLRNAATHKWMGNAGMLWAVSQAAPIRRVIVDGDLSLYEYEPPYQGAGYSSGGFMANSAVKGNVYAGSQQQWVTRNSAVGRWVGGVWNVVFAGCEGGVYASECAAKWTPGPNPGAVTNVAATPTIAEKPFISIDRASGKYALNVPPVRSASKGTDWSAGRSIDFANVYVGNNATDTAATLNSKLSAGLSVVLAPGVYTLDAPLSLTHPGQVLLGLGMATLIAGAGTAVVEVGAVDGVRVAGLLLQAGPKPSPTLLQWGPQSGGYAGSAADPGVVSDVFARVGGPDNIAAGDPEVSVDTCFSISSGNVIIDNTWLWRADHDAGGLITNGTNPSQHGLVVDGDHVTAYGLAVEHHLSDNVVWRGEDGATYFYQCELPYDVTQAEFGDKGYVGYRVAPGVQRHTGAGLGVYHFFRDFAVTVATGISVPPALVDSVENAVGIFLNGKGTMTHVLNTCGDATSPDEPSGAGGAHVTYCCKDGPAPPTPPPPPPPSPKPPPGWRSTGCVGLPPADDDEFVKDAATVAGASTEVVPGMRFCLDCVGRCFEQEAGKCVAVHFNASSGTGPAAVGTCTHYSSVTAVRPGAAGDVVVVAAKSVPPGSW